ncbi:MAG TPA: alpha/beta hydrolase [Burkholderiales bacterium]|jgi:pimeloyl-ACP methyl ester carboxylesterase|nr:alpha/beta hydrolase [Burkholderiales bacterium]
MPLILFFGWLAGLLSWAVPLGALWILWARATNELTGAAWPLAALVMLAWSLFGRHLVLAFYSRGDEPDVRNPGWPAGRLSAPDGSALYVEKDGPADKPSLVLTHGWMLDSAAWCYARGHLAQHYRLVLWDLPGLGQSSQPADGRYTLERLAEDLRAVIEKETPEAERVTLVGHSIGGMMMLTLCRLHPDFVRRRVNGLVFIDTTYTYPLNTISGSAVQKALRWPVLEPMLHLTVWLWPLAWITNWLTYFNGTGHLIARAALFSGNLTRGQLDAGAWYAAKDHPGVVAKGILAALRWNEEATVSQVSVPARVITGSADRLTQPEAAREMNRRLPRSDLVTIDPAGHNGLLEKHGASYGRAIDEAAHRFAH